MKLPVIEGIIKRRMLVNFRADAALMQKFLPAPFRPKLHNGFAIAGICLIRLEQIHPASFPAFLGFASENAAHRVAVEWSNPSGASFEGVYIPRRDTGSQLSHLGGGRLFPGEHQLADFEVSDGGNRVEFAMRSRDGKISVRVRGASASKFPDNSCFKSLADSSQFFECGSLGYSVTREGKRLDGIRLETAKWGVDVLSIEQVESSFFSDTAIFPAGSVAFDHALIMRDIPHKWHALDVLELRGTP